jgi:hypothetical protein
MNWRSFENLHDDTMGFLNTFKLTVIHSDAKLWYKNRSKLDILIVCVVHGWLLCLWRFIVHGKDRIPNANFDVQIAREMSGTPWEHCHSVRIWLVIKGRLAMKDT